MVYEYQLDTEKENMYNITSKVASAVEKSGITDGECIVYCPHTTAGITINENADPDVVKDFLLALRKIYPNMPEFRHFEGNSAAHLKSSFVGSSVNIIVENGKLYLGTWQGVFFCEFDGPRKRRFCVKIIGN